MSWQGLGEDAVEKEWPDIRGHAVVTVVSDERVEVHITIGDTEETLFSQVTSAESLAKGTRVAEVFFEMLELSV